MLKSSLILVCAGLAVAIGGLSGCKNDKATSSSGTSTSAAAPAAKMNPATLQAMSKLPPPPSATKATSLGSGPTMINTANSAGDTDSFWVAQFDIDGDGDFETTQFLWDSEDRILFAYAETDIACSNGGTAMVAILAGVNAAGNPRGRPAGSGFYAIYFDGTECGAESAGLYGARFDASGNITAWGAVVVDSNGDEIDAVGN
jgi:hypothetical protein